MQALLGRSRHDVLGAAGRGVELPDAGAGVGVRAPADRIDDVRGTEHGPIANDLEGVLPSGP